MDKRIIDLYDEYTHAPLDRRVFLERLAGLTGSTAAAVALVPLLQANRAAAAVVAADDNRLAAARVAFAGATGELKGYLARPSAAATLPAVLVIHENRGLNPHIEDVARRVALAGFSALALDFLSPAGGTPENEDQARELIGKLDPTQTLQDALAATSWLRAPERSTGRVGAVGFCWGGGLVGRLATADPKLDAGVVFYGRVPPLEDVPKIKAELLLHYAGNDARINADVPAFRRALDAAGVQHTVHMYSGVEHAFHNDTSAARYSEAAAQRAWQLTVEFLNRTLRDG
jgi:carboxymethylenebutenolidase